jgi:hypothetical protein
VNDLLEDVCWTLVQLQTPPPKQKGKNVILKTEDFQVGDVLFKFVDEVGWKSFATVLSREGSMLGLRYDDPSYIGIIAIFEHLLVKDGVLASVCK